MRITVLGAGSWGTALALLLQANRHQVTLWCAFPEETRELEENRENKTFLPGIPLPAELGITADLEYAVKSMRPEQIVLAIPTQFLGGVLRQLGGLLLSGDAAPILVNVAKGIELKSCLRPSQMVYRDVGEISVCTLSGPSHAEEVVQKAPTAVVAASDNETVAETVRDAFANDFFRVYTSSDMVGVELGGALKNIYAIAAGVCDGMGLGDNSKAALLTRAIAEMARLGNVLGGRPETFSGLSGVGDLIVTCISAHSRNRRVGEEIGRGKSMERITEAMGGSVAEGVKTTLSARDLVQYAQVEAPLVEEAYQVLYRQKNAGQAVKDLMMREPKSE